MKQQQQREKRTREAEEAKEEKLLSAAEFAEFEQQKAHMLREFGDFGQQRADDIHGKNFMKLGHVGITSLYEAYRSWGESTRDESKYQHFMASVIDVLSRGKKDEFLAFLCAFASVDNPATPTGHFFCANYAVTLLFKDKVKT